MIMFAAGILIGACFDIFRCMRRAYKKHPAWLVNWEDAIFLVAACGLLIGVLNLADLGTARWYMFVLAAIGAGIYYLGFSPWLGKLLTWVLEVPKKIFKKIFNYVLKKRKKHYIISQQ